MITEQVSKWLNSVRVVQWEQCACSAVVQTVAWHLVTIVLCWYSLASTVCVGVHLETDSCHELCLLVCQLSRSRYWNLEGRCAENLEEYAEGADLD